MHYTIIEYNQAISCAEVKRRYKRILTDYVKYKDHMIFSCHSFDIFIMLFIFNCAGHGLFHLYSALYLSLHACFLHYKSLIDEQQKKVCLNLSLTAENELHWHFISQTKLSDYHLCRICMILWHWIYHQLPG